MPDSSEYECMSEIACLSMNLIHIQMCECVWWKRNGVEPINGNIRARYLNHFIRLTSCIAS